MRDIRPDLRERLDAIAAQRLALAEEEHSLRTLLQQEQRRFSAQDGEKLTLVSASHTPLSELVAGILRSGPKSAEELKAATQDAYDFGPRAPGRVLHFTLQGMAKNKAIEKIDEKWRLKEGESVQ